MKRAACMRNRGLTRFSCSQTEIMYLSKQIEAATKGDSHYVQIPGSCSDHCWHDVPR